MKRLQKNILVVSIAIMTMMCLGCGDDEGQQTTTFQGKLIDFASGLAAQVPVPNATITALDNNTGLPLAGAQFTTTSAADGTVTFEGLPAGLVAFSFTDIATAVDCRGYNFPHDQQDALLVSVDTNTYGALPGLGGVTQVATNGQVGGAVLYNGLPVGCATVTSNPASTDIRYFNDASLPVPTTAIDAVNGRDSINPLNGFFFMGNALGSHTLTVKDSADQVIATASVVAFEGTSALTWIYADTQPAGCP